MIRREAEFSSKFKKWAYYMWPDNQPAYFELKVSRSNSLPFNEVSEKQIDNLGVRKFTHKFSDFDRLGTPFDMVCFTGKGYVVIQYYKPGNKEFFIIPVTTFLKEREISPRKSLTESKARELSGSFFLK